MSFVILVVLHAFDTALVKLAVAIDVGVGETSSLNEEYSDAE